MTPVHRGGRRKEIPCPLVVVDFAIVAGDASAAPVKRIAATTMPVGRQAIMYSVRAERGMESSHPPPQLAGALRGDRGQIVKEPSPTTNCQRAERRVVFPTDGDICVRDRGMR